MQQNTETIEQLEAALSQLQEAIAALQAQEQPILERLRERKLDQQILARGGGVWRYQATAVSTGEVYTGEVIATDRPQALSRVNSSGDLPSGPSYSLWVHPEEGTL